MWGRFSYRLRVSRGAALTVDFRRVEFNIGPVGDRLVVRLGPTDCDLSELSKYYRGIRIRGDASSYAKCDFPEHRDAWGVIEAKQLRSK